MQSDFTAKGPNRLGVTDLTVIATLEGPLWLSAIRDTFSRRVVAWETSARADADLVLTLLEYALASREVAPGELMYNPRRIQKRLGHLSPIEYEEQHYADQAATEPVNLKPRQPALTS
ncbi:DDE-type integrase/transposase/recombinase [Streptomyces sp. NPDC057617]|uniref:DDE-type integrase/transposase/recombinase n=1 Tax=Streptomyces sp. NPDC057617 TaxID=3346184 RepID=UPI0036AD6E23